MYKVKSVSEHIFQATLSNGENLCLQSGEEKTVKTVNEPLLTAKSNGIITIEEINTKSKGGNK